MTITESARDHDTESRRTVRLAQPERLHAVDCDVRSQRNKLQPISRALIRSTRMRRD